MSKGVSDSITTELQKELETEGVEGSIKDEVEVSGDSKKDVSQLDMDSSNAQRNKNIVIDFHNAIDADPIDMDEVTTFIIAAFQEEDIVLLREFINDILQAHNREIFRIFTEQLFYHRSSPFFDAMSQKIIGSETQDVLSWYIADAIKWYSENLDPEEQDEAVIALVKSALNVVYLLSTQIKASFVDAVIRSCNPAAVITLLKRTDNVECAKEAVAHYLILKLSEIDILDSDTTNATVKVVVSMFEPVASQYSAAALERFCCKIVRKSAKVLARPLSMRETFEDCVEKSKELLSFLFMNKEDEALENSIYSNAVAEIVLLNSWDESMLTPTQIIGDNTRKKAARIL